MKRDELADLTAFLTVAETGNFTRAAARLGTSQSALSHTIQRLEARLGVRLLNRTTRKVAPTPAGEKLAATLRPSLDAISAGLAELGALRERPAGLVRITTFPQAAETILWPVIRAALLEYPEMKVELDLDSRFTDIVSERFDAGVRLGESLDRDMVAVPIGPPMRMALVGSPAYFQKAGMPLTPQDLMKHACINLRMANHGNLYAWEFEKDGRTLNVRVDGPLIFNSPEMCLKAAVDGCGLAFVPDVIAKAEIAAGAVSVALADWCAPFAGAHLYYPSRKQVSPALRVLIDRLRWKA